MKVTNASLFLFLSTLASTTRGSGLRQRGRNLANGTFCGSWVCNERAYCENETCVCKDGFKNPPYCEDINECLELDPRPCTFPGAVCVDLDPNLDGSPGGKYKCACQTTLGWESGPTFGEFGPLECTDVNECLGNPCHMNATCSNSVPGFTCNCKEGFIGDGVNSCELVVPTEQIIGGPCASSNDCADNPDSVCSEAIGKCVCKPGYFQPAGAGGQCQAADFCAAGIDSCDKTPGASTCIPFPGDIAAGFFRCACNTGYITELGFAEGTSCVPHDECADGTNTCADDEQCINLFPPLTFSCVPKTEAPTPAPTAPPAPQQVAIFSTLPDADTFPGSFPSIGYQATSTDEFGDHIAFEEGLNRELELVRVSLTDWACENDYNLVGGEWVPERGGTGAACSSTPGSGFTHPITLNIYKVDKTGSDPAVGSLITTKTQNFFIPFRPSADLANCSGGKWFDPVLNTCVSGYAFTIEFDFSKDNVVPPDEIVYGVAYNTQTHGPSPITKPGPYNSLNFSLNNKVYVGTDVELGTLFWDTSYGPFYCDAGAGGTDTFRRDFDIAGCWYDSNNMPYEPVIEFITLE